VSTAIEVSTVIGAPAHAVWTSVRDIASHVHWMADARSITFETDQREGVGTRFRCVTQVGPVRLVDHMEVTEWVDGAAMGVRHTGVVTGTGRFTLRAMGPERTEFRWEEELAFPRYLGGRLGGPVGRRVLERIWRGNLARLKSRIET
jgi:uncharacterized protein YndB with AHSA1/START domain